MRQQKKDLPATVRFLQVVKCQYEACSEGTRANFSRLGKALFFTVLICGSVLAASFCEFWLARDYRYLPLVFIGTGLFYYILDQSIIMGDHHRDGRALRWLRVFIALVLGLFNSFLIDYYFFKTDIEAARAAEVERRQEAILDRYAHGLQEKEAHKTALYRDIDRLEARLSSQLDSLNAEANGFGGSHKRGIATVWMAKYKNYQTDSTRALAQIAGKQSAIAAVEKELEEQKTAQEKEVASAGNAVSVGINKSLELLHKIIWLDGKFTNRFMSILILLVSMLLELVPLLTKEFFDVEEYFEHIRTQKATLLANASLRMQNAVAKEAAGLAGENAVTVAEQSSLYKVQLLTQDLAHSKRVMEATESYMDELERKEKHWKETYPSLYEQYGKPVIDKAYQTLSLATEKAYH